MCMQRVRALWCFGWVWYWQFYQYSFGLFRWHRGNHTIISMATVKNMGNKIHKPTKDDVITTIKSNHNTVFIFHGICCIPKALQRRYNERDGVSNHQPHDCILSCLQWRHNERDGVSNHQLHDCILSCLFRHRSKKTPKLHVIGLCDRWIPRTNSQ